MNRFYEHTFIVRQDVSAAQVEKIADEMKKIITDQKGKVVSQENWGLRTLAYRIEKNRKGHYVFFNLECPPTAITELERQERIHDDIMRFLSVRVEELSKEPSPMMRNSDDSNEQQEAA